LATVPNFTFVLQKPVADSYNLYGFPEFFSKYS